VLSLPLIINIINAFFGIIRVSSIWADGKLVNLGRERKMVMGFNIFLINMCIKASSLMEKRTDLEL
jgi:hypothetical protein